MSDSNRSDPHPDSHPTGPSSDIEQVSPPGRERRTDVEGLHDEEENETPLEGAGVEDGVGGTGGINKAQDKPTS